jgi:seryl-tRNA synthetase
MANKEQLSLNIKSWLQIDKEMKTLQKELKERRKKKNDLTNSLVDIMKKNEIDCVDISDGKIIYTQSNTKAPINKKHLTDCLEKYFEKNASVPADEIVNFILENRSVTQKETIRLKPVKNI